MNPFFHQTVLRRVRLKCGPGPPVSRILLYPVIHLPRKSSGLSLRRAAPTSPRPSRALRGNLACSHRSFTWPVPCGMPPVGSYPTVSPITCAGNGGFASYRPSAGLLSAALDVTANLPLRACAVPRVFSPGGLFYESGLCSMPSGADLSTPQGTATGRPAPNHSTILPHYSSSPRICGSHPATRMGTGSRPRNEHDPALHEMKLHPGSSRPASYPARIFADGGIEPYTRLFSGLYDALVDSVFHRLA